MERMTITLEEAAADLRVEPRWLRGWLRQNPIGPFGRPLYLKVGRTVLFEPHDLGRIREVMAAKVRGPYPTGEGIIYFAEAGPYVKIGFSRSLTRRVINMLTNSPFEVTLIHTEPGSPKREKELHRQFSASRLRGEWFHKSDEILAYIAAASPQKGAGRA